jgi:dienelactone hydrolase
MELTRSILALSLISSLSAPSFAQSMEERRTVVDPQPNEDILRPCEYSLVLPRSSGPVRAVWAIVDRGEDSLQFYRDRQVRAFADQRRLALVLAMHCRSKEGEDMDVDPARGIGRALFAAFDQFADAEKRPELGTAPLIAMRWSGAGSLSARLAGYRPERFLAAIAYAPGQYDPLGMNTIELSKEALRLPQLIIASGGDDHVGSERPYQYFRKYFGKGAPWTFVIQNRTPHCCLQNAQPLILDWLSGVLATAPGLWGTGKYGYITVAGSRVTDQWKNTVFNATSARAGEKACQPRKGELCAGWLPSSAFAENWLLFVRRADPIAIWKP